MSDINKFIGTDPDRMEATERLLALDDWNEAIAAEKAKAEGLQLTHDHLEVVRFLRHHYLQHGPTAHARRLTEVLEREFAYKGGGRYLYALFPRGPVSQGSRVAGLPAPADSVDPSFGSVQ